MSSGSKKARPSAIDLMEYLDGLYSYAFVLCRDRSDAEHLLEETCFRAIGATNSLQVDSNTKSRLYQILRNVWLDELQKTQTTPDIIEFDSDKNKNSEITEDPHTAYATNVEYERVRNAIQRLPVDLQEVVSLHELEGLSYKQLAALLKTSIGTVMLRLARARRRLRMLLLMESTASSSEGGGSSNPEDTLARKL